MTKTVDTTRETIEELHSILSGDEGYEIPNAEGGYLARRALAVQRLSEVATATGITPSDLITELLETHHDDALDGRDHWADTWALLERAQSAVDVGKPLVSLID